jgi:hypothetical protein
LGGLAIAREFALGGETMATHANDFAAREYFQEFWMGRVWEMVRRGSGQWIVLIAMLPVAMQMLFLKAARKKKQSNGK